MRKNVAAALMCGFFVMGPQTLAAESDNWIQQFLDSVNLTTIIGIKSDAEFNSKDISGTGGSPLPSKPDTPRKSSSSDGGSFTRDISGTGG